MNVGSSLHHHIVFRFVRFMFHETLIASLYCCGVKEPAVQNMVPGKKNGCATVILAMSFGKPSRTVGFNDYLIDSLMYIVGGIIPSCHSANTTV